MVLPIPTGSNAHDANPIGGFGMVAPLITIAYHMTDLALDLLWLAFTNHYRREEGLTIDLNIIYERL